jgi:hypothetical protein
MQTPSPIDLQLFAQIPVVALFAVIVLKMLNGFKQYLKERDELQAGVTRDLTKAISDMSTQIHLLGVSLAETRGASRNRAAMGD